MNRPWKWLITSVVALLFVDAWALAVEPAKPPEPPTVGDPAPTWEAIIGIDDQPHALADYVDAKAVVIVFTCNRCPVAKAYEDRLVALQEDYREKEVQVIAINVNNAPADRLAPMKERAAEKGFNFPYLYDPTQQVGRDHGAKKTPHVFLLDSQREIAYLGAIDDSQNVDRVKKQYLRDAIDAVLAGTEPPVTSTPAVGCGIKYEKKKS